MPSLLAVQTHPDHWQDPLLWKPSRWISSFTPPPPTITPTIATTPTSSDPTSTKANTTATPRHRQQETLKVPAQSTYFPWSDGPQNCPGAKFAQVEFVAVLACLLKDHRVSVVCEAGEGPVKARERALATAEDCDLTLLLRMRDAENVRLKWKRV